MDTRTMYSLALQFRLSGYDFTPLYTDDIDSYRLHRGGLALVPPATW
jgi:hypothetical protein